ncbi:MAG TPA: RNA polymerase sigma factor [Solirubrobacterales bacterium]
MEASALTHASQRGLLARRSPLLKLQGDGRLIAMARNGNAGAFETIVDRYQGRLLGFCRQMLGSTEDAEDVLQEVFVNAYRAMLADEREINLRPWLYRIARNRCLNHLRKPTADAQESMDMVPMVEAAATAEKVHNREEFRQLLSDVAKLPETQRTALLLREMDAMSYEEIASTMDTSVPSVKSLLVRARISLAEASQARQLTCGEVRLELAEAAEGLRKVNGPVRRHVRDCDECADFRSQVRTNDRALAALFPAGPLLALKAFIISKLGLGGAGGSATSGASAAAGAGATATATGAGAGAVGTVGAALGGSSAAGGIGAVGAIGSKAVAGVVTAAALTAGAVGVKDQVVTTPSDPAPKASVSELPGRPAIAPSHVATAPSHTNTHAVEAPEAAAPEPVAAEPTPATIEEPASADAAGPSTAVVESEESETANGGVGVTAAKPPTGAAAGAPTGGDTVVVTVGTAPAPAAEPPAEEPAPAPPPVEETAPPPPPPPPAEAPSSGSSSPGPLVEPPAEPAL